MAPNNGVADGRTNAMSTDTLAPYTRTNTSYGPTATKSVTVRFEQNLRGALGRINAKIRKGVGEDDIFGLREVDDTLAVDDPPPLATESNPRKTALFIQWLREQLDGELLSVVSRNGNPYIQSAYAQGIRTATSQLREEGIDPATTDIEAIVDQGNFQRGLQVLFTRTYDFLEDTADEVVRAVRDELMEGFSRGENPRTIARNLTDRVSSIGKARATVIARTEIINAHTDAYLRRLEDVQEQSDVGLGVSHSEWLTARDDDVCPICRPLDGVVFTIGEMRDGTFELDGQQYQLRPPAHPNCRCTLTVSVGFDSEDLAPLSERLPDEPAQS